MDPRWGRREILALGQAGQRGRAACWRVGSPLSWWGLSSSCLFPSHLSPSSTPSLQSLSSSLPPFPSVGFHPISLGGSPECQRLLGPVIQCPHVNTEGHCEIRKE